MLGSHDTYTYLKSTSWIYNNCKKYWKTQCKSIEEQYAFGIRCFDIRVYRDKKCWRVCHGMANLKKTFSSLQEICYIMQRDFPEAIYRIVLEKGNSTLFVSEATKPNVRNSNVNLCGLFTNLWRVDIKESGNWKGSVCNNNHKLFDLGYKFALVNTWEFPSHELHGAVTSGNFYKIDLCKEAKRINGQLDFFKNDLKNMISSKEELYLLDYCTNEYV